VVRRVRRRKIGRFDPKSETFKEFPLPGPKATPYALGIDAEKKVWYSSNTWMFVGARSDTGKVTEYPLPRAENTMRDFFLDDKGRMWFGSPANDRVGYFQLGEVSWLARPLSGHCTPAPHGVVPAKAGTQYPRALIAMPRHIRESGVY